MTLTDVLILLADVALVLLATARLTRLVIIDDLGRRAVIPFEAWLRRRLSSSHQWIADGLTCPFCVGYWIGALVTIAHTANVLFGSAVVLGAGRLVLATLALNYVVGHLLSTWDIYDGPDYEDED